MGGVGQIRSVPGCRKMQAALGSMTLWPEPPEILGNPRCLQSRHSQCIFFPYLIDHLFRAPAISTGFWSCAPLIYRPSPHVLNIPETPNRFDNVVVSHSQVRSSRHSLRKPSSRRKISFETDLDRTIIVPRTLWSPQFSSRSTSSHASADTSRQGRSDIAQARSVWLVARSWTLRFINSTSRRIESNTTTSPYSSACPDPEAAVFKRCSRLGQPR